LVLSVSTPLPAGEVESPSSLRRRQSVLRVLCQIGVRPNDWSSLRGLLGEEDTELVVLTCVLAVKSGILEASRPGVARLLAVAGDAPWYLMEDIVQCLQGWYEFARPSIESEIERRRNAPLAARMNDQTLRVLLRVQDSTRSRRPVEEAERKRADEP